MAKVRVHHDGWLALPGAVRKRLGLSTGDELEMELAGGGVLLRPARSVADAAAPEPVAEGKPSAPADVPAAAASGPVVKPGPGRPRKTPLPVVPPTLKARGGRRKAAITEEAPS
jgi:AbrB family looped-hinge helix DNA binding protein